MEESACLRTSRKAYRSHVTRILNKVEETLANDIDALALTYLKTAMTQLEKKKEQIAAIDQRIIERAQDADELETAILDSEELQDVILEKVNELNQRVEMFYTICVFCTVRVWYVPYAYGTYHTRTVRFSVPYAYGIDIRVRYVPYAYYAFSQYLLALPSPSYNGLSLQAFLAEQP